MTNKEKWYDRFDTDIPLLIGVVGFASLPFTLLYGCIKNDLDYTLMSIICIMIIMAVGNKICKIIAKILKKSIDKAR